MEHKYIPKHIDLSKEPLTEEALKHIAHCDHCAEEFAEYIEQHAYIRAPRNLSQSILSQSRRLDVLLTARTNQASKHLQLFLYSIKVGAAVAAALVILAVAPAFTPGEQSHERSALPLYQQAEQLTERLNQYSIQLYQPEVTSYDQKEK